MEGIEVDTARLPEEILGRNAKSRATLRDLLAYLQGPSRDQQGSPEAKKWAEEAREDRLALWRIVSQQLGEFSREAHEIRMQFTADMLGMSQEQVHVLLRVARAIKFCKLGEVENVGMFLPPAAREADAYRHLGFRISAARNDVALFVSIWPYLTADEQRDFFMDCIELLQKHTEYNYLVDLIRFTFPDLVAGIVEEEAVEKEEK